MVRSMSDTDTTQTTSPAAKTDAEWRAELTPSSTASSARRAPSVPSPAPCGTSTGPGPTAAPGAARSCSIRREVRVGDRLAELLQAGGPSCRRGGDRPLVLHDPDRGQLRELWRPPRPRLQRRPEPDRPALLHQLRIAQARSGELSPRRATAPRRGVAGDGGLDPGPTSGNVAMIRPNSKLPNSSSSHSVVQVAVAVRSLPSITRPRRGTRRATSSGRTRRCARCGPCRSR